MVVGTKGTSRVTRSVPGKAVGWGGALVCTAPRVARDRYGCVGTTVVAGLVKPFKTMLYPLAANELAIPNPIPLNEPVIKATLLFYLIILKKRVTWK